MNKNNIIKRDTCKRCNQIWDYTKKYNNLNKKYKNTRSLEYEEELDEIKKECGVGLAWTGTKKELLKNIWKHQEKQYQKYLKLKRYYGD